MRVSYQDSCPVVQRSPIISSYLYTSEVHLKPGARSCQDLNTFKTYLRIGAPKLGSQNFDRLFENRGANIMISIHLKPVAEKRASFCFACGLHLIGMSVTCPARYAGCENENKGTRLSWIPSHGNIRIATYVLLHIRQPAWQAVPATHYSALGFFAVKMEKKPNIT